MQHHNKQSQIKFTSHLSSQSLRGTLLGLLTSHPKACAGPFWGFLLLTSYFLPLTILTLIAIISTRHLLTPGFHYGHDVIWHVQRIEAMFQQLKQGHFPVRWLPFLDHNYGIPLFNYLYPLPYYFASIFRFLGFSSITAYNFTIFLFYLLGGWGIYWLFRRYSWLGLGLAVIYLLSPYQLLNLFVRGAFGEVAVLGLAPWVFVVLEDLKFKNRLQWYHPLPLTLALLSHNFLGPILFTLTFIYLFTIKSPVAGHWSLVASLALASFFLLPMFFERSYLLSFSNHQFSYPYQDHFLSLSQLIYSRWGYGFSLPGPHDGLSFQLGLANWFLVILGLTSLSLKKVRFFLISFFGFLFLTLPVSNFVWQTFPLLQTMQFPWRFLAFLTFFSLLIGGLTLEKLTIKHKLVAKILIFASLILAVINTRNYHRPQQTLTQLGFQHLNQVHIGQTTTSNRAELTPRWAAQERGRPTDPTLYGDYLAKHNGGLRFLSSHQQPGDLSFEVLAENSHSWIKVYQNYFPSWQATIDGQPVSLKPSPTGEILIQTKQGRHHYHLWVGQTKLEQLANFVSLATFLYIIYLLTIHLIKQK